jgi:ATP-binding protein involved in chromosome partitioning
MLSPEKKGKVIDLDLAARMADIRHKIVVMSGKGGVGKSTVSANLAIELSIRGYETGLLDADITGPDIAKMFDAEKVMMSSIDESLQPIIIPPRLKLMTMAFLLPEEDAAVPWMGPMRTNVIRQFLSKVAWGKLDFLIVDMPPGTGDELLDITSMLQGADGAIIVTTPQDVALQDARRSVGFARSVGLPILGIVENMSGFRCPHCGERLDVFKTGGGERIAMNEGVEFLGRIPLEERVALSGDIGMPVTVLEADNPASVALRGIVDRLVSRLEGGT